MLFLQVAAASQAQASWDPGDLLGPAESPEESGFQSEAAPHLDSSRISKDGAAKVHEVQAAVEWEAILQKLDPDDQVLLLKSIDAEIAAVAAAAAEKAAAAERAAAMKSVMEKDSEIAVLREALDLREAASLMSQPNGDGQTAISSSRRLAVSGESYTPSYQPTPSPKPNPRSSPRSTPPLR